jgi:hypothetical protein
MIDEFAGACRQVASKSPYALTWGAAGWRRCASSETMEISTIATPPAMKT